jgi:hypothetical protein
LPNALDLFVSPICGGIVSTAADLIGTVPLFERLDAPLRKQIEAITDETWADPDQVVSQQGTLPTSLYVLLEGQVALSSTAADGTTALVEVLHPIDHFVLASVLTQLPTLMTATTVTRCRLLAINAGGLLDLVEREAPLANTLLRSVSREFIPVRSARPEAAHGGAAGLPPLARVKDGEALRAEFRLPFDKGCWQRAGLPAGEPIARLRHSAGIRGGDSRVAGHPARHPAAEGTGRAG